MKIQAFRSAILAGALASIGGFASAVPQLQLTIDGGYYAGCADQTTCAAGSSFSLYALGTPGTATPIDRNGTFYLSIAVIPQQQNLNPAPNYGFFKINGATINVTADMIFGTPPEPCTASGCLSGHGIYDTYYKELAFNGFPDGPYNALDVQNLAFTSSLLTSGSSPAAMYARKFEIDASGLTGGIGLHFDLYDYTCAEAMRAGYQCDATDFAPYSHDAQFNGSSSSSSSGSGGTPGTATPEPGTATLALLGLGLIGAGMVSRRRKAAAAQ